MARNSIRSLVVLITGLVPAVSLAAGVDLRPKFQKGQELHYLSHTDIEQSMTQGEGATPMTMTIKSESGMRFRVLEAKPDGSAELEWTMLYMAMSMGGPMAVDFDSRDPAKQGPPMGPMLKMMIDKPATVSVDSQGKVTRFEGFDPASLGPMGQSFAQAFSKEGFEQSGLLPTSGAPSPAEPGAKWSHALEIAIPQVMGTMIQHTDYTLLEINEAAKKAEIGFMGKSSMKAPPATTDTQPASPMMIIDKGNSTGSVRWDLASGHLDSTETDAEMDMTVNIPMGKMVMKQKINSKVKKADVAEMKLSPTERATEPGTKKEGDNPG